MDLLKYTNMHFETIKFFISSKYLVVLDVKDQLHFELQAFRSVRNALSLYISGTYIPWLIIYYNTLYVFHSLHYR